MLSHCLRIEYIPSYLGRLGYLGGRTAAFRLPCCMTPENTQALHMAMAA